VPTLTKARLLDDPLGPPTAEVHVSGLGGSVVVQAVNHPARLDTLETIRAALRGRRAGDDTWNGFSDGEIALAHWLSVGVIDPPLKISEAREVVRRLRHAVQPIVFRFAELSKIAQDGLLPNSIESTEPQPFAVVPNPASRPIPPSALGRP
jgi:hypothetical protein